MADILIPKNLVERHSPQDAEDRSKAAQAIGAAWVERFINVGGLKADHRVLDIGCGPGRMAIAIGERLDWKNQYFGFDIFKEDIDFATKAITGEHPTFKFGHLDIRNEHYNPNGRIAAENMKFPVPGKSFDFAFATSIFTHFNENDVRNYVSETYASLASGGTFLATFFLIPPDYDTAPPNPKARFRLEHKLAPHVRALYAHDPLKAIGYDLAFIRDMYAKIGFQDLKYVPGSWNCAPGAVSNQDILVARKLG